AAVQSQHRHTVVLERVAVIVGHNPELDRHGVLRSRCQEPLGGRAGPAAPFVDELADYAFARLERVQPIPAPHAKRRIRREHSCQRELILIDDRSDERGRQLVSGHVRTRGTFFAQRGQSSAAHDETSSGRQAKNGTPKSTVPAVRSTSIPTPTGSAPRSRTASRTSRTLPPVVRTSSTTSTRSPGPSSKPRLNSRPAAAPSFRSAMIA